MLGGDGMSDPRLPMPALMYPPRWRDRDEQPVDHDADEPEPDAEDGIFMSADERHAQAVADVARAMGLDR
jgi:hypothetical protein